jgi:hypothetical protein
MYAGLPGSVEAHRAVLRDAEGGVVTRVRPRETKQVGARDAAGLIRKALTARGTCSVDVGSRRRTLAYDPRVDAPRERWPWPLRLFQPHTVRYVVYEDARRVSSHIFVRNRMEEAIEYFLRDLPPDAQITVTIE